MDVRILAATNRDLEAEVAAGRFRADLYHRLAVYPIHVPPLRERRPDIPLLAAHFVDLGRQRLGLGPVRLTEDARERLVGADWPGNVRELENVISRGVLRAARQKPERAGPLLIGVEHLDLSPPNPRRLSRSLGQGAFRAHARPLLLRSPTAWKRSGGGRSSRPWSGTAEIGRQPPESSASTGATSTTWRSASASRGTASPRVRYSAANLKIHLVSRDRQRVFNTDPLFVRKGQNLHPLLDIPEHSMLSMSYEFRSFSLPKPNLAYSGRLMFANVCQKSRQR